MTAVRITERQDCRVCGSTSLNRWVHLAQMPLTDDLRTEIQDHNLFLADIDVYVCESCGVSQTVKVIDLNEYYKDYAYTVASSGFANRFMERLAESLFQKYELSSNCTVLEVGSGDGKQLTYFQKLGADVFGFEPSSELCRRSEEIGVPVFQGLFSKDSIRDVPTKYRNADVLLLTYTFDHIPEPTYFLEAAKQMVNPETGLLVIEVHDLEKIVERREYCLFEHEHFVYLTSDTMGEALKRNGFELLSTELLPESERRGNSLLIVATPSESKNVERFKEPIKSSKLISFDTFNEDMVAGIRRLDDFIEKQISEGKKVAGYGAGGRGVMTMAAMQSAHKLSYVCDNNTSFHGFLTPKSNVIVKPPKYLEENPVDILLVFSFGYLQEIKEAVSAFNNAPKEVISMLEVL
ncbi:class I SAM-dependent methyltransferase [Cohnella abietis]|uniref:Methyltransferase n=1 Tax=Cohnella abietis TaxID=2507935 RepID=A0A3T1DDA1_9BACL|nr:class I SAM-dependent methyltransferase [Cohnella abietis]BBI36131.1 methyltransferase [Cohnella abietis]